MKIVAVLLAAGSGARFGGDKVCEMLGGKPVWRWSFDTFLRHPRIDAVGIVNSENNDALVRSPEAAFVVSGGPTRQESSKIAFEQATDADLILIHDAARPFVSPELIDRVIDAALEQGAAAAALKVTDTLRQNTSDSHRTLDRESIYAMQTPQAALRRHFEAAHAAGTEGATDEVALLEAIGIQAILVEGSSENFKITYPEDLLRARAQVGPPETRTGLGYDIHAFSDDSERELWLGGVHFPGEQALEGHSDADVLLHAAVDALLGAAGLGDIGVHFPPNDPQWKGEPSLTFLKHAAHLLNSNGWRIVNLDIAAIAEKPKIMPRAAEIRATIAHALQIEVGRISVKATTNEKLGSLGRSEGIAAFATATISGYPRLD